MVYLAAGKEVHLDLSLLGWREGKAWWFDCKSGEITAIGSMEMNSIKSFKPATRLRGNDWVLVIDNEARNFDPPGTVSLIP